MSKTLNRALDILDALSRAGQPMSVAKLSHVLDMHPSTAYRLLKTLGERGFVIRDAATSRFSLGLRLVELASAVRYEPSLIKSSRPILAALVKDSGETANLVVPHKDGAIYVDQVQCDAVVRGFTRIGARAPLHCAAVGKVLLANSSPEDIRQYVESTGLPAYTSHTITNPYALAEHLERVKAQGFAVDDEEREVGTSCIAAPVRDNSGKVIAAISISGPSGRLREDRLCSLASRVKKAAAEISSSMGFIGVDEDKTNAG
jgi:IclR family KDG regulon transcriptional repressor